MRAEPLNIDWVEEIRAFHRHRSRLRTPGRHLSDITSRITKQIEPGRYPDGPIDPVLAHQGFVWEDVLSTVFADQFGSATQLEAELDNIIGTLDGLKLRAAGVPRDRVQEFKFTKISAGNPITSRKFQPWMLRSSAYCKMVGTDQLELVGFFANGSYELGGGRFGAPVMKGWLITFTRQEIEENWEWIQRVRDEMDAEDRRKGRR